eukprot:419402-Rhodomonas_salina.1
MAVNTIRDPLWYKFQIRLYPWVPSTFALCAETVKVNGRKPRAPTDKHVVPPAPSAPAAPSASASLPRAPGIPTRVPGYP